MAIPIKGLSNRKKKFSGKVYRLKGIDKTKLLSNDRVQLMRNRGELVRVVYQEIKDRGFYYIAYSRTTSKNPRAYMRLKSVKPKDITAKISGKFNINRYGLKGMEIHNNSGKVLKVFNSKSTDTSNWLDAVKWAEKNKTKIKK